VDCQGQKIDRGSCIKIGYEFSTSK
jgi:hypothetical protein